ncbi:MAG: universal stress protein [Thermoplasmata archaeon]
MDPINIGRITVALDGSPYADHALSFAIDIARRYSATLTVLAVAPMVPLYLSSTEPWAPTEMPEGEVKFYRELVDSGVARAQAEGVTGVTGVCLEGHVVDEIVAYLEGHPTDMLVLGSRGLSAAKRLLLGSISDAVVHHVGCPVLIVRGLAPGVKPPTGAMLQPGE